MDLSVPSIGDRRRTTAILVGITLLALVLRFVVLGDRTAHWDEARVGFWTLDYMQTGNVSYRPIIHGPFYHHVNPTLFGWFGKTDTAMRIAPAFISGLLPLTALLFRDRLRRVEMAALGLFLAVDPVFLYYSRFMRGDPLVAAFMFAGFAFFVRAIDTKRGRHVFVGTVLIALGFTTKENALVYVMCWVGALVLLFDQRLIIAQQNGRQWLSTTGESLAALGRHVIHWWKGLFPAPIAFFLVIIYFYAPRVYGKFKVERWWGGETVRVDTIGLLTDPTLIPPFISEATVGSFIEFFELWGNGSQAEHAYLPYFFDLLGAVVHSSAAMCLFAILGLLITRYGTDNRKRSGLVLFAVLWGGSSMFVYPLITDIKAPWAAIHVVLPLMLPAAIGVGGLIREGYAAINTATSERPTDQPSVADGGKEGGSSGFFGGIRVVIIALILLIATVQIGLVGINDVYLSPGSPNNELVQYAQPTDDLHPTMSKVEAIAGKNVGTDVVVYSPPDTTAPLVGGDPLYQKPSCLGTKGWFNSLPLPWYFVRSDASVACINNQSALVEHENEQGQPPVIIAKANHTGGVDAKPVVPNELKQRYPDYEATIHRIRTTDQDIVFLINRDRVSQKRSEA